MTAGLTPAVSGRLNDDSFGWLTTVAKSGLPVPRLIWFLLDGPELSIYTLPSTAKVAHIRRHPQVTPWPSESRFTLPPSPRRPG